MISLRAAAALAATGRHIRTNWTVYAAIGAALTVLLAVWLLGRNSQQDKTRQARDAAATATVQATSNAAGAEINDTKAANVAGAVAAGTESKTEIGDAPDLDAGLRAYSAGIDRVRQQGARPVAAAVDGRR